ncbi:heterodisulfide reductase-related iron-sulfur binding cluster [Marinilabiliaceae bacterium ANBcel2]|nr:heterodisulfide reductase-related iron-sulfur binding cluster [Marinilabiliaceae bacterium ANBcel2]
MLKTWNEYQKEVPDDHFFYVRSCIRQTFFPGSETMLLRILREHLNKDVFEDPRHTTCTGIGYHSDIIPLETIMTVVGRQLALMTEAGYKNLLVSCVTSFGIYLEILDMWKHFPEKLENTKIALKKSTNREFEIPESVSHASDVIFHFKDKIREKSNLKLINLQTGQPLKVVDHIGCHYAKIFPHEGFGGAEFPSVLSGLIKTWGGEMIDYPERRHCCGFGFRHYLVQENRGYSISNAKLKFESMAQYKPDFIIANCPGCTMFLDKWQYALAEMTGKTYDTKNNGIPVLTYEELAGLMLGHNPWQMGMQMHQINVEPLLEKLGYNYCKKEKYYLAGKPTKSP